MVALKKNLINAQTAANILGVRISYARQLLGKGDLKDGGRCLYNKDRVYRVKEERSKKRIKKKNVSGSVGKGENLICEQCGIEFTSQSLSRICEHCLTGKPRKSDPTGTKTVHKFRDTPCPTCGGKRLMCHIYCQRCERTKKRNSRVSTYLPEEMYGGILL